MANRKKRDLANWKMQTGFLPARKLKDDHPKHCHLHLGGTKEHGVRFYVHQERAQTLHKAEPDEHLEQCKVQPLVPESVV